MARIIICCDGTWNSPSQKNKTNVFKFHHAVLGRAPDGVEQHVYYDRGVGAGSMLERLPGLFGAGVWRNVQEAYAYLAGNYSPGDEIYLAGFSRGAYTVRSVVGMVRKCGILRRDNLAVLEKAYRFYRNRDIAPGHEEARRFRAENSVQVGGQDPYAPSIRFLGVWDTVGALGIPSGPFSTPLQAMFELLLNRSIRFHDVALSRSVEHAYQALAIDESRGDYRPTLWEQHPQPRGQVLEQAWFAGAHTDVGGGAPQAGQSDRTLLWMVAKARALGLAFDEASLPAGPGAPDGPLHNSFVHVFKLRKFVRRPLGSGVPAESAAYLGGRSCEVVDASVLERHRLLPDYHPPNLVTYYREHPHELEAARRENLESS